MIRLLLFQFQISAEYVSEQRGIFRYFIENINGYQWLSFWLSSALIVFQGLLLGQLISEYNVIDRPGYSILFFYGLLTSLFGGNLLLSYVIIGGGVLSYRALVFISLFKGSVQTIGFICGISFHWIIGIECSRTFLVHGILIGNCTHV